MGFVRCKNFHKKQTNNWLAIYTENTQSVNHKLSKKYISLLTYNELNCALSTTRCTRLQQTVIKY